MHDALTHTVSTGNLLEWEVVKHCARVYPSARSTERLAALAASGVSWNRVAAIACRHCVLPLVYRNLSRTCSQAVPIRLMDALGAEARVIARTNLYLSAELLSVTRLFSSHHIPLLPFKGPLLAAQVYGEISLRESTDLDLLLRMHDALRAKDLLSTRGYRLRHHMAAVSEEALLRSHYHFTFSNVDHRKRIELHWAITPPGFATHLDFDGIWDRARPIPFGGGEVLGFDPGDLLLTLCMHATKHGWERLKWICDIAEIIRAFPTLEWNTVLSRAHEAGVQRMVLVGLCLAHDILDADLPPEVQRAISEAPCITRLADRACDWLLSGQVDPACQRSPEYHLFQLAMRDGWLDRTRYFMGRLPPSDTDRNAISAPYGRSLAGILTRPVHLLWKYRRALSGSRPKRT